MKLIKRYQKWTTEPTRRYTRELRGYVEAENFGKEWSAELTRAFGELKTHTAASKPGKSEIAIDQTWMLEALPFLNKYGKH